MAQNERLPDFLVIGGMKCATTTMHQDLSQHPNIDCGRKELNALTWNRESGTGSETTQSIYAANFKSARSNQMLGDVSTTYSMTPDYPGVAERALELLGPNLKLVFIARNPVLRTISHHQHMMNQADGMGPDINTEINKHPQLVGYSCYAKQLTSWIESFGIENLCVIRFEDYVSDRSQTVDQVVKFLGLEPHSNNLSDSGANRTGEVRVAGSGVSSLIRSRLFQDFARPLIPNRIRELIKPLVLKKTQKAQIAPTPETIESIIESVSADHRQFCSMVSWEFPAWDFDKLRNDFAKRINL